MSDEYAKCLNAFSPGKTEKKDLDGNLMQTGLSLDVSNGEELNRNESNHAKISYRVFIVPNVETDESIRILFNGKEKCKIEVTENDEFFTACF